MFDWTELSERVLPLLMTRSYYCGHLVLPLLMTRVVLLLLPSTPTQ